MQIILTSLVNTRQNSKEFLFQSEASYDDYSKDKRIISWPPFMNTVYKAIKLSARRAVSTDMIPLSNFRGSLFQRKYFGVRVTLVHSYTRTNNFLWTEHYHATLCSICVSVSASLNFLRYVGCFVLVKWPVVKPKLGRSPKGASAQRWTWRFDPVHIVESFSLVSSTVYSVKHFHQTVCSWSNFSPPKVVFGKHDIGGNVWLRSTVDNDRNLMSVFRDSHYWLRFLITRKNNLFSANLLLHVDG